MSYPFLPLLLLTSFVVVAAVVVVVPVSATAIVDIVYCCCCCLQVDTIDSDLLFGNMPEIAALSSKLLHKLETATINVDINDQIIG